MTAAPPTPRCLSSQVHVEARSNRSPPADPGRIDARGGLATVRRRGVPARPGRGGSGAGRVAGAAGRGRAGGRRDRGSAPDGTRPRRPRGGSPARVALGDSVRAVFAVVAVARRAVDEGLAYPQLSGGRDGWAAFWGATVDTSVEAELAAIAAALPPVSTEPFDGDADAVVDDLYPHLVDRIARGRLVAGGFASAPRRLRAGRPPSTTSWPGLPRPSPTCRQGRSIPRSSGSSHAGSTTVSHGCPRRAAVSASGSTRTGPAATPASRRSCDSS